MGVHFFYRGIVICVQVAILGAGPAGLEAAMELLRGGISPTVFEKKERVGSPVRCGEALLDLHSLFDGDPPGSMRRISELLVHIETVHHFPADNTGLWIMDKREWLESLVAEARSLGASIEMGRPVLLSDIRKEYDYVIDCSGCPSQSLKEYGVDYGPLGLAIQYRVSCDLDEKAGKLGFHYIPGEVGFRWIFPKSRKEANIGVGWAYDQPREKWDTLNQFALDQLGDFEVQRRISGYLAMQVPSRLSIENILLCGDAAGLANPYHGGGIHNAMLSGRIASRCLVEGSPGTYDPRLRKAVSGELKVANFARSILEGSYKHHEMMVSYLEKNVPLEKLFTHETYRRLLPYIGIWNIRSLIRKTPLPSI